MKDVSVHLGGGLQSRRKLAKGSVAVGGHGGGLEALSAASGTLFLQIEKASLRGNVVLAKNINGFLLVFLA